MPDLVKMDAPKHRKANNTMGWKGCNQQPNGKWRTKIDVNRKQKNFGTIDTIEQAYEAYC